MFGEMQKGCFHKIEFSISVKEGEREKSGAVETESEVSIVEPELSTEYIEGISGIKKMEKRFVLN